MPDKKVRLDLDLAFSAWEAEQERTKQKNIIVARSYYDGDQDVPLTERMKEMLGFNLDEGRWCLNYCATVVKAVFERMIVMSFEKETRAEDRGKEKKRKDGDTEAIEQDPFAAWAWDLWNSNRMDAKQVLVHKGAGCEGQYFVFVDWDKVRELPVFIPHRRYTDADYDIEGDNFGCKAFYPDDDVAQPIEKISKRWSEKEVNPKTNLITYNRFMTVYYPNRIERWIASTEGDSGWVPYEEDGIPWPVKWTEGDVEPGGYDEDGVWQDNEDAVPLGIPIIHFYCNAELRGDLWDAITPQDLINKTSVDIINTADACGFPIRLTHGWMPTSDGKPPEADGGNYLKVFPGCWIATPEEGTTEILEAADIAALLESLDSWIIKLAQITDTPISRFQMTRQIAAEDTQKQQEAVLLATIRNRQSLFGNGWEDCMAMAAKIAAKNSQTVPEGTGLDTMWEPAEVRDDKAFREAMMLESQMGVPQEMLWEKLGYDEDERARMRAMRTEQLTEESNIGGEMLKSFERGGGTGAERSRGNENQRANQGT